MLASGFWCCSYLPQCTLCKHYSWPFSNFGFRSGRTDNDTINFLATSWDYNKNLDGIMTQALRFILQMYTSAFVSLPYCLADDVLGMRVHVARHSGD